MEHTITIRSLATLQSIARLAPAELKSLIDLLKSRESSPGGPYLLSDSTKKNVSINLKIYLLFLEHGKQLKGCFSYLQSTQQLLTQAEQRQLKESSKVHTIKHQTKAPVTLTNFQITIRTTLTKQLSPELYEHIKPLITKLDTLNKSGEIATCIPTACNTPVGRSKFLYMACLYTLR